MTNLWVKVAAILGTGRAECCEQLQCNGHLRRRLLPETKEFVRRACLRPLPVTDRLHHLLGQGQTQLALGVEGRGSRRVRAGADVRLIAGLGYQAIGGYAAPSFGKSGAARTLDCRRVASQIARECDVL